MDPKDYWQYQYDVMEYLLPLCKGRSVLDVGCGEGGGLCCLYDHDYWGMGFDIELGRILNAQILKDKRCLYFARDDWDRDTLLAAFGLWDTIILHDVIEHMNHGVFAKIVKLLSPGGRIVVSFPPYYSAFGGHQQVTDKWYRFIPWAHLLVDPRVLPHKTTMKSFEATVGFLGLRICVKDCYVISLNHIRFGLKPILSPFSSELCTGVVYVLEAYENSKV